MKKEIAISVKNISKTFRIPRLDSHKEMLVYARLAHNKVSSARGAFVRGVSPLWKRGARGDFFEEFKALDNVSFEVEFNQGRGSL